MGRCDLAAPERRCAAMPRPAFRGVSRRAALLFRHERISAMSATTTRKTSAAGTTGDRVVIFDTTLRDGEQSPGASMNLDEKIKIALLLEEMGVDVIEAGFPIASNGDFEAVREIAKLVKGSTVCGLARAARA